VALFGIECASGDTFTDGSVNFAMTSIKVPDPVMSVSLTPKSTDQLPNFQRALQRFQREDPTFTVSNNAGARLCCSGVLVLAGSSSSSCCRGWPSPLVAAFAHSTCILATHAGRSKGQAGYRHAPDTQCSYNHGIAGLRSRCKSVAVVSSFL
jgi:hypothetical protein